MSNSPTTATETPSIVSCAAPVAGLYGLNAQLLEKSLADLKSEHLHARANEFTNSIHWIYGHITATRYEIARFLGAKEQHNFKELFAMAADHKSPEDYPALEEIQTSFKHITTVMDQRFAILSEKDFCAAAENDFPSQEKTVCGCVTFLNFHETYHVGQIALLKKFFGYDRLVG